MIYPVDSVIQLLNWGLVSKGITAQDCDHRVNVASTKYRNDINVMQVFEIMRIMNGYHGKILVIYDQILPTITTTNLWRPQRRICMFITTIKKGRRTRTKP